MNGASDGGRGAELVQEQYSVHVTPAALGVRVVFRGIVSGPKPSEILNPFLDGIHARVAASGVDQVVVDLRELEFCNSSGFKCFVHWIHRIQELPEARRYRLRFVSSPDRRWQRTSLLALSCFGTTLVDLEPAP